MPLVYAGDNTFRPIELNAGEFEGLDVSKCTFNKVLLLVARGYNNIA